MEWISVKDKLPELEERVLVTNGNYVEIKYLYDSNAFERNRARARKDKYAINIIWYNYCSCGCGDLDTLKVTHWTSLPNPPKI